jgi:hypothetical protein
MYLVVRVFKGDVGHVDSRRARRTILGRSFAKRSSSDFLWVAATLRVL